MKSKPGRVPEYLKVKRDIEGLIRRGELPGGLVPGERGLARKLQANVGTVRRAVTELASEGKLVRVPRIGTVVPSAGGSAANSPSWAVIVPIMEYFYAPLLHVIEEEARARGTSIVPNCIGDNINLERELVQRAVANGACGVLLAPAIQRCQIRKPETLEYLEELGVPVVIMDHWGLELPPAGIDCVLSDNFAGAYEATTHMIRHGYTQIVAFRSIEPNIAPEFLQREKGYEAAMADHNLPIPPLPLLYAPHVDHQRDAFKKTIQEHLTHGVDAVVVFDDGTAFKFMNLLHELDVKVPDQMAVIGYDNEPFAAYTYPTLSSIEVPKKEMGRRAAKLLHDRITTGAKGNYRTMVLRPRVVARQSCGRNCPSTAPSPAPETTGVITT